MRRVSRSERLRLAGTAADSGPGGWAPCPATPFAHPARRVNDGPPPDRPPPLLGHRHDFLAPRHAAAERRSWAVIGLCLATMAIEIGGGIAFGSIALVADGLHMSTHACVLLVSALAYRYARRHVDDARFSFGTGKIGDLAGFSNAIALGALALLIGWEALDRFVHPVPIRLTESIGLAVFGLVVNAASLWLLMGGPAHGRHAHRQGDGRHADGRNADGRIGRDNNMLAILLHLGGDAAVSILVILGLVVADASGSLWLDPLAGVLSAAMVLALAASLVWQTGAVLLDRNPDPALSRTVRRLVEADGGALLDFHLWRLGPGHLGAIASIGVAGGRTAEPFRRAILAAGPISHLSVELVRGRADIGSEKGVLF